MRLADKIAIVIGAGQSPGEGMGNGRATALRFAREGARRRRWQPRWTLRSVAGVASTSCTTMSG
jgi:NAD(P)-dependent dehydrogenase (short-subunit alcohol dehydrogenase family)